MILYAKENKANKCDNKNIKIKTKNVQSHTDCLSELRIFLTKQRVRWALRAFPILLLRIKL